MVLRRKLHNKTESNLKPNENRIHACGDLWGANMKIIMEHSMEENGEHRKCGCPPDMRSNYPCQLYAPTSKSFSE